MGGPFYRGSGPDNQPAEERQALRSALDLRLQLVEHVVATVGIGTGDKGKKVAEVDTRRDQAAENRLRPIADEFLFARIR